jgi:MFS family permease
VVLLGVGISWPGVIQARFMDSLAGPDQGTTYGFVRTVYMFFGAAGSVVTGTLADGFGWLPAFGLPAALLVFAGGFLLVNRRQGGRY